MFAVFVVMVRRLGRTGALTDDATHGQGRTMPAPPPCSVVQRPGRGQRPHSTWVV